MHYSFIEVYGLKTIIPLGIILLEYNGVIRTYVGNVRVIFFYSGFKIITDAGCRTYVKVSVYK